MFRCTTSPRSQKQFKAFTLLGVRLVAEMFLSSLPTGFVD